MNFVNHGMKQLYSRIRTRNALKNIRKLRINTRIRGKNT